MKAFVNIDSLVRVDSDQKGYKSGFEMNEINEIKNGAVIFDEKIHWIGNSSDFKSIEQSGKFEIDEIIDCSGHCIMPGFVDSHTHIVFAGNRSNEFGKRLRGYTYQQIAEEGGGILSTMRSVRNASIEELIETGRKLAYSAMSYGTTTIEIKSGYAFTLEGELKMLRAIKELKKELPINIYSTFLGAHDFPPEYRDNKDKYVDLICNEMIPAVAEENLAEFCDAFVDKGYYTLEQGKKIFETAQKYGLKLKIHCDELADVSAAKMAGELGALSADHLLFISDESIKSLNNGGTVATLLPGTAYNLRLPYAPFQKLLENDCKIALATDCNPGSCFTENMQFILSLSVTNMKMSCEAAISASTINGAAALGIGKERGSIEIGKFADFSIFNSSSYTDIFYHFGINHCKEVWINGKKANI
jgi:imidazolonepropionase